MEYLPNGNLADFLKYKKFLISEKLASIIALQLINTLIYLRNFGIIHRDLKPDNIMIANSSNSKDFQIKLSDFGLSKILGNKETTKEGYGTLIFVAPEIIHEMPYNNSVDIWSFGVIMYYIISGKYPFDEKSDDNSKLAKKIAYQELKFPVNNWKNISNELKELIIQCLQKNPRHRIKIDDLIEHQWFALMANKEYDSSEEVKY
jgi:serine/threonine protein kinase